MYAIVQTGGKQYVASPGEVVRVESLQGEPGDVVEFDHVVTVSNDDGSVMAGSELSGAKVKGVIEDHGRGKKVIVFKFKRRKMYRRRNGHRQNFTNVKIEEIAV
jgi:large subunit ribosomal protein L21